MTRQGFLNLGEDDQSRVYQAALDEFARADFAAASLNQIIENAGISKGSMYHYFQNKEDLYFYILERAMTDKAAYLKQAMHNLDRPMESLNLFEKIHIMMQASIHFARAYPRYHRMNTHLQNMPTSPLKERVWDHFNRGFDDFIKDMVNQSVEAGELNAYFDSSFVIRILRFFLLRFGEFYPKQESLYADDAETIDHDLNQLIRFLQTGLRNTEGTKNG